MQVIAVRNLRTFAVYGAFNILLVISSNLSISLPFTPVPITLQTLGVFLTVLALGKKSYIPIGSYILEGSLGLPVFAGWTGGIWKILGPTGGYIFGFLVSSLLVGYIWDLVKRREIFVVPLGLLLHLIVYAFGIVQLSMFVGWEKVLDLGVNPFVLGDTLKIILVYLAFKGWRVYTRV